jgi:hypothetical protein
VDQRRQSPQLQPLPVCLQIVIAQHGESICDSDGSLAGKKLDFPKVNAKEDKLCAEGVS